MKKIFNGLKRISLMLGTFCMSLYTKVIAIPNELVQPAYGVAQPEPKITITQSILEILKTLIIPIAFVIGIIIYFKKSSSGIGKKILMTLISLAVLVLIVMGINYIITNML